MRQTLETIAAQMIADGKGILAADESDATIAKRFAAINTPSTEEKRRDWRELLLRAQAAMRDHISGVILFDETIRQTAQDGHTKLVELITQSGAVAGIKVDRGAKPLAAAQGETITEGLDGLRARLEDYHRQGARFAKWRAVIKIGGSPRSDTLPSRYCMEANAHALARYAALCQEAEIVPIIEPEILMDGDHDINTCLKATEAMLNTTYRNLRMQRVHLEGTILKPNMVVSGTDCPQQAGIDEVAEKTLACLRSCVPACVPGIAFLSGGQSDQDATAHLNAINQIGDAPWKLTFSYGRALQAAPLAAWRGQADNVPAAQSLFAHRARMNGLAARGQWSAALENQAA